MRSKSPSVTHSCGFGLNHGTWSDQGDGYIYPEASRRGMRNVPVVSLRTIPSCWPSSSPVQENRCAAFVHSRQSRHVPFPDGISRSPPISCTAQRSVSSVLVVRELRPASCPDMPTTYVPATNVPVTSASNMCADAIRGNAIRAGICTG